MARNRRPQADAGGEVIVALGPFDQPGETVLGKFGAGIVDGALDYIVVAAQYQHVGHRAAQHPAGRDCHQMRLALAAGGFDQRLVVEPFRSGRAPEPAISMISSNARVRMVAGGALLIGARRLASSVLADVSM